MTTDSLEGALANLDNAADFYNQVVAASKAGQDTTATGAFRDAWEWLRDAALQVSKVHQQTIYMWDGK